MNAGWLMPLACLAYERTRGKAGAILETLGLRVIADRIAPAKKFFAISLDSIIAAGAWEAGVSVVYSEDMQDEMTVEGRLKIINPFVQN